MDEIVELARLLGSEKGFRTASRDARGVCRASFDEECDSNGPAAHRIGTQKVCRGVVVGAGRSI